jgi:hypothetical protein
MEKLPTDYIVSKFIQYAGFPKYSKHTKTYHACCPICHEGKSWGKKKRCFFIPKKDLIYCQNCQRGWRPLNWIMLLSGLSFNDILKEVKEYSGDNFVFEIEKKQNTHIIETLPTDSINLFNQQQVDYYKDNKIVQDALNLINQRRLNTLINKPKALYISLKDYVHKNRLCIPFYNTKGEIIFYQTRALYKEDMDRKYLSKVGADKAVFGLDKVNPECDYLFIFEGPIDSMCVTSGIAVCGITLTEFQQEQLKPYHLYEKIWILDNQLDNKNVRDKVKSLLDNNERVFLWPDKYKEFKDMNEICKKFKLDRISESFFIKNSYKGLEGLLRLQNGK